MSRIRWTILVAVILIVSAGVGTYIWLQYLSPKKPQTVPKEQAAASSTSIKEPTVRLKTSGGRTITVFAHQILARISDDQTVKSFGNDIKPIQPQGVYVITVTGDLNKAAGDIRKKPGVVWAEPREVVVDPAEDSKPE